LSTDPKAVRGLAEQAAALRAIRASAVARYAVAVAAAAMAILLRLSLDPVWGMRLPYITLFPGIMLSAWLGGFWPGVVTTVLCATSAQYFLGRAEPLVGDCRQDRLAWAVRVRRRRGSH
jgi:hypothetical protein